MAVRRTTRAGRLERSLLQEKKVTRKIRASKMERMSSSENKKARKRYIESTKNGPKYLVLIDESGDMGRSERSSRTFVMSATLTDKPEVFDSIPTRYLKDTRYDDERKKTHELKFNSSNDEVRNKILKEIDSTDPIIHTIIMKKSDMGKYTSNDVYKFTLEELVYICMSESELKDSRGVEVVLDNNDFLTCMEFAKLVVAEANNSNVRLSREPRVERSIEYNPLQTHDFVASSAGNKYNGPNHRDVKETFYDSLRNHTTDHRRTMREIMTEKKRRCR
ncbi:MAG: DUF3800 domain-containing protein [Candidatus Methanomethylophilaceae archaeon]|nr:DUF3800 domain-containing protein [Candidatus Methanomethylophilaceae archaeon]